MAAVGSLAARVRGYPGTPARWRHWGGGSSTAFRAQGGSSRVDKRGREEGGRGKQREMGGGGVAVKGRGAEEAWFMML